MKVVHELIEYLYHRGQLDKGDLGVLQKEGFYPHEIQPETQIDDEDDSENPEINDDEQPLSIEDIEEQNAADEQSLTRKGKGRRAFKPEKKWSLEHFNNELLPQIEALDGTFSPLYRLVMKGNKAEIRQILTGTYIPDEEYIKDTLERVLLYHYGQEPDLAQAVLTIDYLETFFDLSKKLSPKNRDRVREWVLGKRFLHPEPNREAIFWARQMLDLQIRILKIWRDLTPSVLERHHKMGYGTPFLAKAKGQEESRLAAHLLMCFIFLHNFDNPKKPDTQLFLLLEKEGIDDAYQTMAVFFQKEMYDMWQRVPNETAFDMPYWLHKLNERHEDNLFLATDLWLFDAQKQSLLITFTHAKTGQKLVCDNVVCDKNWFKWYARAYNDDMASGVFCTQYDEVGVFSEDMAAVRKGDTWGFVDTRGILVIPCQYKPFDAQELKFTEGVVACVRASDDKRLYLNKSGKDAFPNLEKRLGCPIQFARSFAEGFAIVGLMNNHWQIINHFGHLLLDEDTASRIVILSNFSEGFAVFKQITGEFGFINPFGEQFVIENTELESYDYLCSLRENMAAIRNNQGKWGFVNVSCRLVIPCIYDWVWSFSENRAAVCRDGVWGFLDVFGHEIIPPQYLMAGHYWNGHAGCLDDSKKWVILNRQGHKNLVKYDAMNVFSEGEAVVFRNGRMYLLDTQGNESFNYNFTCSNLTEGYFVCFNPPSALKILRKNHTDVATIQDIQSVHYFAKGLNLFESERVTMFENMGFDCFPYTPYTIIKNWCLSEGFMGVQTEKTDKWTFAFFDDAAKKTRQHTGVPFHILRIENDLFLVDKKQKIGIKITCPPDSYVDCEFKTGNRLVLKIGDEAIILRHDLILEKMNLNT